ncbi:chromate efflux transporter [Methylocystis echinoides]|uniref:Chromate transporter n=1 Tax=Methylocystis echinoides TaxID=29468 RepID=A0A9W6LTY8_9HYPH|nr:chromate efflux transporter [Methylocystis echinoides]GLI95240.1 chromate transporter [Methylocystis echinoides]
MNIHSKTAVSHDHGVSLAEASRVWARVALLSFGGPAGQIAVMHRIIVDEKKWVPESRFLHALNYCMLLPGPEAQQLATYIGWLMHRTLGGIVAGGLFILPGVVSIMALSVIYALWGNVAIVAALFFGLKAAVLAIVVEAVVRIGKRGLKSPVMRTLAAASFVAIFFFAVPFPIIILAAALLGYFGAARGHAAFAAVGHGAAHEDGESLLGNEMPAHARPSAKRALHVSLSWLALWLVPVAGILLIAGSENVFSQIAVFFSKMAVVTFGGAYAVLAYVAQQAVETYHWLKPAEMLDGLGMAETTPGPLIMVLQFVGFMAAFRSPGDLPPLLAGALGGLLATWVTFAPCFLWIFLGAPYIETVRQNKAFSGALAAITAAVVGVILNLAIWFAIHTIFRKTVAVEGYGLSFDAPVLSSADFWSLALSVAAASAIFRFSIGVLKTLAGSCVAGMGLFLLDAI